MRGALTDGHEWIFFLLKCHEGTSGAKYFQSECISIMNVGEVSRDLCSLIAAIIADWVRLNCIKVLPITKLYVSDPA